MYDLEGGFRIREATGPSVVLHAPVRFLRSFSRAGIPGEGCPSWRVSHISFSSYVQHQLFVVKRDCTGTMDNSLIGLIALGLRGICFRGFIG